MNKKTVLEKFRDAFPDLHKEKAVYYGFYFGPGAMVYINKSKASDRPAHIIQTCLEYFPNGSRLESYLKKHNVPLDKSHYYYIVKAPAVDDVISILKGKERSMGIFEVKVGVRGKSGGSRVEVSAMVDTGATDTVLPPSILRKVGVEVEARRRFILADGSHVELGVGEARLSLNNEEWTCPVVFGTDEEQALLGATTLEIFNLMVDPVLGELIPRQLRARQI